MLEDFESAALPSGWDITTNAGDGGWKFGAYNLLKSTNFPIPTHTKMTATNDDKCKCNKSEDLLITKSMDFTGYTNVFLKFDSYFLHGYVTSQEEAYVKVSTDGGSNWTVVYTVTGNEDWVTQYINLSSYAGMSDVMVELNYTDGGLNALGWAIDNFEVYVPLTASDAAITQISPVDNSYTIAGNVNVEGIIFNNGYETLNDVTIYYTDGVDTFEDAKTGLNIPGLGSYSFVHATPYNIGFGDYTITAWIEAADDGNATNNNLSSTFHGVAFFPSHQVVVEEATGSWCGWCVRGIVYMDSIDHVNPNTSILIAVHNGDPMADVTYDAGIGSYPGFTGYPTIITDRKELGDPSAIFKTYDSYIGDFGYADIAVTPNYIESNDSLYVTADVTFATPLTGNYRLACAITEENVTGTASGYNQANYYAGGGAGQMGGFEDLDNPVPAADMVYNYVAREIIGGFKGASGSLPTSLEGGVTYSYTFKWKIPSTFNPANMRASVLLIDYDADVILNGNQSDYFATVIIGINNPKANILGAGVYPNPANGNMTVSLSLNADENVTVEIADLTGHILSSKSFGNLSQGNHLLQVDAASLRTGMYMVNIRTNSGVISKRFVKAD